MHMCTLTTLFTYLLLNWSFTKRDSVTTRMSSSIHNWDNTVVTHFEDDLMYQIYDQFVYSYVQEEVKKSSFVVARIF
jgi:hypothetical protein